MAFIVKAWFGFVTQYITLPTGNLSTFYSKYGTTWTKPHWLTTSRLKKASNAQLRCCEPLLQVSAEYSVREDGVVQVKNRGFSIKENKWNEIVGKAYFVNEPDEGYLKVSFFGPLYGSYVIFELDKKDYQYAFVSGPNESYLWFLSRTPTVSHELKEKFQKRAKAMGYKTEELIWVKHK